MDLINKITRLLRLNRPLLVKIIGIILGLILIILQVKIVAYLEKQEAALQKQKALVMRLAEFQSKIDDYNRHLSSQQQPIKIGPIDVPEEKYVLEGTTLKNGVYYALVNGAIYMQGDVINDYQILEIHKDSVLMENKKTKAVKNVYFLGTF